MSDIPPVSASRAVFLSYASQDAEAVLRIAEALRAAGIVVWFDKDELTGGDAWDAKIRKQIAECALFVPVISAATQARSEGYFRIEWRLAAQRTHGMADDTTFLLPVVIDDTRDAEARVPAEFRAVQWTRLPGGETPASFFARVGELLGGEIAPASSLPVAGASLDGARGRGRATPLQKPARRPIPVAAWVAAFVVVAGIGAFFALRKNEPHPVAAQSGANVSPAVDKSAVATTVSPAREWVLKARALYEPWDLATLDDFKQAEQFLNRAIDLDPSDAEAWAARGVLSCGFYTMHGTAMTQKNRAMSDAERAVKLAPASDSARFALAYAMRLEGNTYAEAMQRLRELLTRQPRNKFILRILGLPLSRRAETAEEGLALLARAAALPGGDPIAEYLQGESLVRSLGRETEGLAAIDRALALAPNYADAHNFKIVTLLDRRGDLEEARAALDRVPTALLREDRVIVVAAKVWFAANEPERVLRTLAPAGTQISAIHFKGPTGYLKGMAHRRAGRLLAAQTEWRAALQEVQKRLEAAPTDPFELSWKVRLLTLLGDRAEAQAALDLYGQFATGGGRTVSSAISALAVVSHLAPPDVVLRDLSQLLSGNGPGRWQTAARILFDPAFDLLRADPKFAALVEQAKAYYAERKKSEAEKK